LSGSGADDHNVNRAAAIFGISIYDVGPLEVVVVRGDQTFPVYRGVSPVVEQFVERVGNRLMPFDGSGTIGAAHGMVAFGVTKPWAGGAIVSPKGARARTKNVVGHPDAD
jgi:hypothetical protein